MKKLLSIFSLLGLLASSMLFSTPAAVATQIGSACKSINAKGWSGNNPIVCKKNSRGKLVWIEFQTKAQSAKPQNIKIILKEIEETRQADDSRSVPYCNSGGRNFPDISSETSVEIRDGQARLLATRLLGSAKASGGNIWDDGSGQADCVFTVNLSVKRSDFYQIEIGSRYEKSFSFDDLAAMNWRLELFLEY
jgi:hypothetical protein